MSRSIVPFLLCLSAAAPAAAADLSLQLRLLDASGLPLEGPQNLNVRLVDDGDPAPPDTICHTAAFPTVQAADGFVAVELTGVSPDCLSTDRWVSILVDGAELTPRTRLHPVPSAGHVAGWVDLVTTDFAVEPPCTVVGRLVFDTTAKAVRVCDGTSWIPVSTGIVDDGTTQDRAIRTCRTLFLADPTRPDGLYWIDPDGDGDTTDAFRTWCDMADGGWTLVLQNNAAVDHGISPPNFVQSTTGNTVWGNLDGGLGAFDLLIGLDEWGQIGTEGRIEVGPAPGAPTKRATFASLTVTGPQYTLNLSGQTLYFGSDAPGLYTYHAGRPWSAYDQDNDAYGTSCSVSHGSLPWWYGSCWSGSLWGHNGTANAYWAGSTGDNHPWGALWLR